MSSLKELVFRYMSMDEKLTPADLRLKIESEHNLKYNPTNYQKYRKDYFASIGKKAPVLRGWETRMRIKSNGKISIASKNNQQVDFDSLQQFSQSVKALGGVSVARQILSLFE